jgi:hypothetical protein
MFPPGRWYDDIVPELSTIRRLIRGAGGLKLAMARASIILTCTGRNQPMRSKLTMPRASLPMVDFQMKPCAGSMPIHSFS